MNQEHFEIIGRGVGVWNDWRAANPGVVPDLSDAALTDQDLSGINLADANLARADFTKSFLRKGNLQGADCSLRGTNFRNAVLRGAQLQESNLSNTILVNADIAGADLSGCRVYGVSSWDLKVDAATLQHGLVITPDAVTSVVVDDIEVAQFVYLLLNNQKIRNVVDTVGSKGVLVLGRFTERKQVLEAIRAQLRRLGYLPIVFDFERPVDRDFTETIRILAGLSRFIVADITKPRSVPLEAQATIPEYAVPFVPIIEKGEEPFAMFRDLWQKHQTWVLAPLRYETVEELERVFERAVIDPANERLLILRQQKAREIPVRDASSYT